MRRASGQDDLADAQRIGLLLVELERRDELARKALELPLNPFSRSVCLVVRQSFGRLESRQRECPFDGLGLGRSDVELARNRNVQARPAPIEDAGELADPTVGDGERGAIVADRDDDDRRARGAGLGG